MTSIVRTLRESEVPLLHILAQVWGVSTENLEPSELIDALGKAMRSPDRAEIVWESLSDEERGALQTLISLGSRMAETKFERLFGPVARLSKAELERTQPHLNPTNIAEALFYRGMISKGFENADTGARAIIYVPDDMIQILPTHKTAYENLEDEDLPLPDEGSAIEPLEDVENPRPADTSLVDDMTTLLAYLRLYGPALEGEILAAEDLDALLPHLIKPEPERLVFSILLGVSADLIEVQGGRAYPKRSGLQRWLSAPRHDQVRQLAEAWRESSLYTDLWHVPGLTVEKEAGTMHLYNPAAVRGLIMEMMKHALPPQEWWSIEEFIDMVREDQVDFQRPNGDFDSWYIRSDAGDYLSGLESWDAVEGALLDFVISGPMHWLGLTDLADDAARLTAYGRALLGSGGWPQPAEPQDKIEIEQDGTILVSRRVSRMDRFQVARFSTWVSGGQVYSYRLDARGIARGADQGITTSHIATFLDRALGDQPLPPAVARLLENWKAGPTASVTIERLIVLRTTAPETLDFILDTPALRRFLGARLGSMAAAVRADQWAALRDALGEHGIQAEISGL